MKNAALILLTQTRRSTLFLSVIVLLIALPVALTDFPLHLVTIGAGVLALIFMGVGWLVYGWAERAKRRSRDVIVDFMLDGIPEAEMLEYLVRWRGFSADYKDMKRRLSQVPSSDKRAQLFLEITQHERSIEQSIDELVVEIREVRELRKDLADSEAKLKATEQELDEIRRKLSILYRMRRSFEDFLPVTKRDQESVNELRNFSRR